MNSNSQPLYLPDSMMNLTVTNNTWLTLHSPNPKQQLAHIEGLVSVTFFLLVLQFPIGFLRRRNSSFALKVFALGTNAAIASLIPYIFGLMHNSDLKHELVPIWAAFLVFVYSGIDPNPLFVNDPLSYLYLFTKFLLYLFYAVFMIPSVQHHSLLTPLLFLLVLSELKLCITIVHRLVAQSLLRLISKCNYLTDGSSLNTSWSDEPLLACQHVVDPRRIQVKDGKIVDGGCTIQRIWSCEDDSILSSKRDPSTHQLKNTCLSFSLFWLLLHKFAGVPTYESLHQKDEAWDFVRNGLLEHTNPFNVIEEELSFLGDFFISKYFLIFYRIGFWWQPVLQLIFIGAPSWIVIIMLKNYHPEMQTVRIQYHNHDVDVLVTGIVSISIIVAELVQLIIILSSSRWSKVTLICTYVSRESWKKRSIWDRCIKKAAQIICPVRGELCKPWQRKLKKYSLLDSCSHIQHYNSRLSYRAFKELIMVIRFAWSGRGETEDITLSNEIKMAVIQSLKDHGPHLTNGMGSLKASQLGEQTERKLLWACTQLNTDTHVILVWHIATSICQINPKLPKTAGIWDDFLIATSLSEYCAYLVAFAPDLLPGHATSTYHTCSTTIEDAYALLKDCKRSERYNKLMDIAGDVGESEAGQRNMRNILQLGADLGKQLETEIEAPRKRWKVLARFWAEMILYLAPNLSNERAHAKRLAEGGEFITHLWALLFHAGIVDRDSLYNKDKDASRTSLEHRVASARTSSRNRDAQSSEETDELHSDETDTSSSEETDAASQANSGNKDPPAQTASKNRNAPARTSPEDRDAPAQTHPQGRHAPAQTSPEDADAPAQTSPQDRDAPDRTSSRDRDPSARTSPEDRDAPAAAPSTSSEDRDTPAKTDPEDMDAPAQTSPRDRDAPARTSSRDRDPSALTSPEDRDAPAAAAAAAAAAPSTSSEDRDTPAKTGPEDMDTPARTSPLDRDAPA